MSIRICAIWEQTWVIAMDYIVYVVLCEQLFQKIWCELIWNICDKQSLQHAFRPVRTILIPHVSCLEIWHNSPPMYET